VYPSSRLLLARLTDEGIPVTWGTLAVASDPGHVADSRLTSADVVDIATNSLGSADSRHEEALVDLAMANPVDDDEVRSRLQVLAKIDGFDQQCEERKLRLIAVDSLLGTLPTDPVHGLLTLSEFWIALGSPSDSPHIVQGAGGDRAAPTDYYTSPHYHEALAAHRQWLAHERANLREQCAQNAAGPDPSAIRATPRAT
jgi:hypothetical protein